MSEYVSREDDSLPATTDWMREQWKEVDTQNRPCLQTPEIGLYWHSTWTSIIDDLDRVLIMDPTRAQVRQLTEILGD